MKINAILAATALISGAMISVAPTPTARAEVPTMEGVYTYSDEDGMTGTWTITTTCTPGCVAHVSTGPGRGFDAPFVNGRYAITRIVPEGVECPWYPVGDYGSWVEASTHTVAVYQWWDPKTLTGEVDFLESGIPCVHDLNDSFTLTKVG